MDYKNVPSLHSTTSPGVFTMVFFDFDDTLIPTSIRQSFLKNLSIDIFDFLSSTELKKLQYSIIKAIETIRLHLNKSYNNLTTNVVKFCIVSNAKTEWLNYMFYGVATENIKPKLRILDKYLKKHDIDFVSAIDETYEFLTKKFNANQAQNMMASTMTNDNKINKWMWKYTTFSSKISSYKRKYHLKLTRIISFGDGDDEIKALNHYSTTFNVESLHISFIKSPTFYQIRKQWKYLQNNINKIIINNQNNNFINVKLSTKRNDQFYIHNMNNIFNSDNDKQCIGKDYQLPAIAVYFQLWMNKIDDCSQNDKRYCLGIVCQRIHCRLYDGKGTSTPNKTLRTILSQSICINEEFNEELVKYHQQIIQKKLTPNVSSN